MIQCNTKDKKLIKKLMLENKKLRQQKNKLKNKSKKSFVLENFNQFESLIEALQKFTSSDGKERYFFERKSHKGENGEVVFKLNLFVSDLIEFKARVNVEENKVNSRISMDKGALIQSLSQGRVQRPRK